MNVLGIDLSLAATGLATADEDHNHSAWAFKTKETGAARMRAIRAQVLLNARDADLVVIEGPSYGSTGGGAHERAGLWWLVVERLDRDGVPVAIIPPATLKKFATGSGKADKDAVLLATARRFPSFSGDNNAADALWLAAAGAEHLGHPLVQLPRDQTAVLMKVNWPNPIGDNA
ncbi:MAG TPA: hypothetical protein VFC19_49435 [Candidatus Limnocylindrales bacterium]|nr:hypothetical protein [Candidatus Limnocylindrales bacterium]